MDESSFKIHVSILFYKTPTKTIKSKTVNYQCINHRTETTRLFFQSMLKMAINLPNKQTRVFNSTEQLKNLTKSSVLTF